MVTSYEKYNFRKKYLSFLIIFCCIAVTSFSFSQSNRHTPEVKLFNLEEGLSQVSINDLIKDDHGFIWIATADGLNRFDGKLFKHYKYNEANPNSLRGSFINKLLYDHKGRIWIGTLSHGLSVLDENRMHFRKTFQKKDSSDIKNITALELDDSNNLWIGSENEGLYRLNLNDLSDYEFIFDKPVTALKFDAARNTLWIGDLSGTIHSYNINDKETPKLASSVDEHVRSFFLTDSNILIGANEGMFRFDPETKKIEHKELETSGAFQTKYVLTFLKKDEQRVWVGTGNGVYLYNWLDNTIEEKYENGGTSKVQLSNNTVHCSLQLSENSILIGTASGLNLIDFDATYFNNISKDKKGKHALNDNVIFSVHKNDIGLWVGTSRGGLNLITDSGTYYYTHHQNNTNYIAGQTVRALQEDAINKRLWIATSRGLSMLNLKNFNPNKPQIQNFYHNPNDSNSINTDFLKDIALDANNNIWGASFGQGIFRLELDQNNKAKITRYAHNKDEPNSLVDNVTQKLEFDSKGNLWIGARNGLSKLSFKGSNYTQPQFKNFAHNKDEPNSLSENSVYDICEDLNGNIWIGTRKGLNVFKDNRFRVWTAQEQFPNDIVYILDADANGHLWLGTNDGIVRFDPEKENFSHYDVSDNIQGKEFDIHARYKDKNGTIYFGGIDGVTYFHPENFNAIDEPQQLYFSQLRLKNNIQEPLTTGSSVLDQGLINTSQLQFKHHQLPFYLEVSSIGYRIHKNVDFAYRLLPGNEDWVALNDREIQFLNLPNGTHTLQVNGFSRGKEWNQPPLEMTLKILPPWWASWWAYLLYAGAILTMSYYFYRFKVSRKLAVAESTKLKELSTLKSNLYTNITHEFRTPLTVILGLADTLKTDLQQHQYTRAKEAIGIIERNGKDLLQLVNQLLGLSKVDSGTIELNLIQADIIPFLRYVCESFQSLAQTSNIEIVVYTEEDELMMDFDDHKLQIIIANLLSNAIKFSPQGEKIIFHTKTEIVNQQEFLVIKVKDHGSGIPAKDLPHIFDRFYQVENPLSKAGKGTGIGLALTKELATLMKGTISVNSQERKGTEFALTIPITKNASMVSKKISKPINHTSTSDNGQEWSLQLFDNDANLPKALIIEDNKDVAYYLKLCLQNKYHCHFAHNGDEGLTKAFEKIPDIIICDVMMPGKDGFEVCKTLKTDTRTDHIPVIMLTAKASKQDRLKGLKHGADAYLTKPFFKAELLTRLDQLILLRKRMMQTFAEHKFSQIANSKEDNPETKFLQKVIKIIHNELDDQTFGARHIAQKLRLSESQIYRKLKAITGKSTAVFIRSVRLEKAKELLQTTEKTVSEIAYEVGFNDPSWFSRAFKEEFGHTPSAMHK